MTEKRRKPGRPKGSGKPFLVLYVKVPPDLKRVVEKTAADNGRKITGEIIFALKRYYQGLGLWPPADVA